MNIHFSLQSEIDRTFYLCIIFVVLEDVRARRKIFASRNIETKSGESWSGFDVAQKEIIARPFFALSAEEDAKLVKKCFPTMPMADM